MSWWSIVSAVIAAAVPLIGLVAGLVIWFVTAVELKVFAHVNAGGMDNVLELLRRPKA